MAAVFDAVLDLQKTFTILVCGEWKHQQPTLTSQELVRCQSEKDSVSKKMKTFLESQADSNKRLDDKVKRQVSSVWKIKKGHTWYEFLIFKGFLTGTSQ